VASLIILGHLAINKTKTKFGQAKYFGGAGYHCSWVAGQLLRNNKNQVALVSQVGKDFNLEKLRQANVDTSLVAISDLPSDQFVIKEVQNNNRSFEVRGDLAAKVNFKNINSSVFENCRIIHLATAPPDQQIKWLNQIEKLNKFRKPIISVDSFELFVKQQQEKVAQVFSKADLVFANKKEWQGIKPFLSKVNFNLVLKDGENGASFLKRGKKVFLVPAIKTKKVVDTTGAGEIIAGAFLALRLSGWGNKEGLKKACCLASLSIRDFGIEHIKKYMNVSDFTGIISSVNESN